MHQGWNLAKRLVLTFCNDQNSSKLFLSVTINFRTMINTNVTVDTWTWTLVATYQIGDILKCSQQVLGTRLVREHIQGTKETCSMQPWHLTLWPWLKIINRFLSELYRMVVLTWFFERVDHRGEDTVEKAVKSPLSSCHLKQGSCKSCKTPAGNTGRVIFSCWYCTHPACLQGYIIVH